MRDCDVVCWTRKGQQNAGHDNTQSCLSQKQELNKRNVPARVRTGDLVRVKHT